MPHDNISSLVDIIIAESNNIKNLEKNHDLLAFYLLLIYEIIINNKDRIIILWEKFISFINLFAKMKVEFKFNHEKTLESLSQGLENLASKNKKKPPL